MATQSRNGQLQTSSQGSGGIMWADNSFHIRNPPDPLQIHTQAGRIATIGRDGIFRFCIEANDQNAAKFIECIERVVGKRITGVDVTVKPQSPPQQPETD